MLNEEFTPSEREVGHARALLEVYDDAAARGSGAVAFGGLVDDPVARRARALVSAAEEFRARDTRHREGLPHG